MVIILENDNMCFKNWSCQKICAYNDIVHKNGKFQIILTSERYDVRRKECAMRVVY